MRQLLMDFMTDAVDHIEIQVMEFQLEDIRKMITTIDQSFQGKPRTS